MGALEKILEYRVLTDILKGVEASKNKVYRVEVSDLAVLCGLREDDVNACIINLMKARFPMNRFINPNGPSLVVIQAREPTFKEITTTLSLLDSREDLREWTAVTQFPSKRSDGSAKA